MAERQPLTDFAGGLVAAVLAVHLAIAHHVLRHAYVIAAVELVVLATWGAAVGGGVRDRGRGEIEEGLLLKGARRGQGAELTTLVLIAPVPTVVDVVAHPQQWLAQAVIAAELVFSAL